MSRRHVFVIGFMAVGKSTVGALAAERLGLPFRDLDQHIEQTAGATVAEIFAERGEAGFRQLEAEALRALIAEAPALIACGGGTPCHLDNLSEMRAHGLVVTLTAPFAVLLQRMAPLQSEERPLFARPLQEVQRLYQQRQSFYRQAHACVATEQRTPEEVAIRLAGICSHLDLVPVDLRAQTSAVALAERIYPVVVESGALGRLGEIARAFLRPTCERVALVSDDNVAPLYGAAAEQSLRAAGFEVVAEVVPAGEASKSFAQVERLCQALAAALDRRSAIVALGGGVVGDLAGFVAATLFRGIDCLQVPTSLLAMVDSAIGGKTGIDIAQGKNLVGAFWQPRAVVADPDVLRTLPAREYRAAFGELIKYGLLAGGGLLADIEQLADGLAQAPDEAVIPAAGTAGFARLVGVIRRCAAYKGYVVTCDEREQTGERAMLNLGHTVGHAIEVAGGYREVLHGEAVALGLLAACRVALASGLGAEGLEARVAEVVAGVGLSTELDRWLTDDVLGYLEVDKKRTGRSIGFIAPLAPGDCIRVTLELDKLSRILRTGFTV